MEPHCLTYFVESGNKGGDMVTHGIHGSEHELGSFSVPVQCSSGSKLALAALTYQNNLNSLNTPSSDVGSTVWFHTCRGRSSWHLKEGTRERQQLGLA